MTYGFTIEKTRAVPGTSARPSERKSRCCHPGERYAANSPGEASGERLSPGGHQGLVYSEPCGRGQGGKHRLVRIILAVLRRLSGSAVWQELVPVTGTVAVPA